MSGKNSGSNISPMHGSEMTPSASATQPFTGGLPVTTTGINLRTVSSCDTSRTSANIGGEPKREAGLQGPATGPGLLSNHVVVSSLVD